MKIINIDIKRAIGKDGEADPVYVDYSTLTNETFILQDSAGKPYIPNEAYGWYYAGSVKMSPTSGELLWLCKDFTLDKNKLTFNGVDTYTSGYLAQVKKKGTLVNVEVGVIGDTKEVFLRDYGYASPRVYVEGVDPHDIEQPDFITRDYFNEKLAEKQDIIDSANKLSYGLISGAPSISDASITFTQGGQLKGSFTLNQASGATIALDAGGGGGGGSDVTSAWVEGKIQEHNESADAHAGVFAEKQDVIDSTHKLAYSLISGTPSIPTKTSDLVNDSSYATSGYVDAQTSGKADKTYVTTIAAASSNVQLQDGAYVHTPTAAVTYALPAVTDTLFHTIILTVSCAHTTSITFTYNGATVTPLDSLTLSTGDKAEYLCRWESISSTWIIACGRL